MFLSKYTFSGFLWFILGLPKQPEESLPIRGLTANPGEATWEDFEEWSERKCPIRFKIHTFVCRHIFGPIKRFVENVPYWIRTHTYNRYHIIDIRQPKNSPGQYHYRWGWLDRSQVLPLAMFNILQDFVENEFLPQYWWGYDEKKQKSYTVKKKDRKTWQQLLEEYSEKNDPKPEDIENYWEYEQTIFDRKYDRELLTIYKWWTVDRIELCRKEDEASKAWREFRQQLLTTEVAKKKERELFELSRKAEEDREKQEEDILIRLVKIHGGMWT